MSSLQVFGLIVANAGMLGLAYWHFVFWPKFLSYMDGYSDEEKHSVDWPLNLKWDWRTERRRLPNPFSHLNTPRNHRNVWLRVLAHGFPVEALPFGWPISTPLHSTIFYLVSVLSVFCGGCIANYPVFQKYPHGLFILVVLPVGALFQKSAEKKWRARLAPRPLT